MSGTGGLREGMHRTTRRFSCTGYIFLVIVLLALAGPVAAVPVPVLTIDNSSANAIASNLSNVAAGGTLILNPGTYFENGLVISQDITLRANTSYGGTAANTIIDGSDNQIITVNGGCSLIIDNLTLENGVVTGAGGAIYNQGTLTVTSSTFTGCQARFTGGGGGTGGAIDNEGTITGITTSSFTSCMAIYGGAIYSAGTIDSITATSFTDCLANGGGTAIYNTGTITSITTSVFSSPDGYEALHNSGTITSITSSAFNRGSGIYRVINNDISGTITSITTSAFNGFSAGGYEAINNYGTITATDNWWGTNTPNFSVLINGAPAPASWLVLGITASPSSITGAQTSLINANLTWDSNGIYHNPALGHVPDGIAVSFSSTGGTLAPASGSMVSGANTTRFTPAGAGISTIRSTVELQNVTVPVTVTGPAFTASPTSGTAPLAVTFTDASVGSPTMWNWSFGDGQWSNTTVTTNPVHTYAGAGTYTVNLTVTIGGSALTLSRTGYITVAPVPIIPVTTATPSGSQPINGGDDAPASSSPSGTDTVNVGGNSAVGQVIVTGTGIADLVVTGTVQQTGHHDPAAPRHAVPVLHDRPRTVYHHHRRTDLLLRAGIMARGEPSQPR